MLVVSAEGTKSGSAYKLRNSVQPVDLALVLVLKTHQKCLATHNILAGELTESFSLPIDDDRRLKGETYGYFEIEYDSDLA